MNGLISTTKNMTQEEKQLLLKDLCARLLYGVKLHIEYYDLQGDGQLRERDIELTHGNISYCFGRSHWSDFKPYLRPMSSMTDEEKKIYNNLKNQFVCRVQSGIGIHYVVDIDEDSFKLYDWLNKKMFDYRELIPMGLALEAPEDMYKLK